MIGEQLIKDLRHREACNNPIKVAVAGTGFIGRGLINQIGLMKGIRVTAVANRNPEKALGVLAQSGISLKYRLCKGQDDLNEAVRNGETGVVADPLLLTSAEVDIVCDCTGDPETGAALALSAIEHGRHFIANPETDATVGPLLKYLAEQKGLVYSGAEGDEPGVIMNLFRYVSLLGLDVVAAGKFKRYHNPFATPSSVKPWADKFEQNPNMLASFADGTKMSIEMALVANATGLVPEVRGMHCPRATLDTVARVLSLKEQGGVLHSTGVVEVVLDVEPSGGIFVVATTSNPQVVKDLQYLKMGDGPNYLFYRPYHLCAVEMAFSVIRAVLANESTIAPIGAPVADVLAVAKRDLKPGEVLDCIGGHTFYGLIDKAQAVKEHHLLPVGMAQGARILKPVRVNEPISRKDVEAGYGSVLWKLKEEQDRLFA